MRLRPDMRRQPRLGIQLSLAALALAAAIALAGPDQPRSDDGSLSVLRAAGTLSHDNSRDGAAILSASGIWPGWSGNGDVTITNDGSAGSWLRLTQAAVADVPGPGGGELSGRLQLAIQDVTVPGFPVALYSGSLATVGERWLGLMAPGEARTYRFTTAMPALPDDNDYQASAVSARFEWAVSDTDPSGAPVDPGGGGSGGGGGGNGGGGTDPSSDAPSAGPTPAPSVNGPPASEPPDEDPPIQVVPDGPPVVVVNRGALGIKLAIPQTQRPLRDRRLLALASCSRRCTATFGGRIAATRSRPRGTRVASVSRSLSAGIQERVGLRISRKAIKRAMRLLARGRAVRGTITLVARDSGGRVARATQRIRLVPARDR